jgi:hypothetical protein
MIEYTAKAQYARALLLRKYNDLLVFVEDPSLQYMYIRLVNKILGGAARVEHVFGLGGRAAVVEACMRNPFVGPKPAVYLIDGDLDLLTGANAPPSPRLYRINAYSVENILIDEMAIVEVAAESQGNLSKTEVATALNMPRLAAMVGQMLLPLFVVYAVAARLDLPIATVSFSVVRLCRKDGDAETLSQPLIRRRIRDVRNQIIVAVGRPQYVRTRNEILDRARALQPPIRAISGKAYLLPLLTSFLGKKFRFRDSSVALRTRLAQNFNSAMEPELGRFILASLGSGSAVVGASKTT